MISAEETHQEEGGFAPPSETERSHRRDFIGAFLLFVVSVAFAIASLRIPFQTSSWVWYTSPGLFALSMAIFLGLCSVAVGYRGLRGWLRERHTLEPVRWGEGLRLWGMGRFLASVAIILVYLALLGRVPFLLASVGLILTFGTVFREGRLWDALRPAIIAALVVVVFSFVIMKVFGITFP
jgi:hypothetical protein